MDLHAFVAMPFGIKEEMNRAASKKQIPIS